MTRSIDPDQGNTADRHEPTNADTEEREIDQILADSFPASDSPPWTLGVVEAPIREPRAKRDEHSTTTKAPVR